PARLRDLLHRHVEPVLGEDAGLLGEGERREAGPSRNADGDLGALCGGRRGEESRCGKCSGDSPNRRHGLLRIGPWMIRKKLRGSCQHGDAAKSNVWSKAARRPRLLSVIVCTSRSWHETGSTKHERTDSPSTRTPNGR